MDAEHARGDGVHAVKVVQQPCIGAEPLEHFTERPEIKSVEQGCHQWWRGSGVAARHSHAAAPVVRHAVWSMAPSYPTRSRSSSANAEL